MKSSYRAALILGLLAFLAPSKYAWCQCQATSRASAIENQIEPMVFDPSTESDHQAHEGLTVNLLATREKTSATASLGFQLCDLFVDITASGPIDEKAEEVELANLDGIANGFNYAASLSYLIWRNADPNPDQQRAICKEYTAERFGDWDASEYCAGDPEGLLVAADGVTEAEALRYQEQLQTVIDGRDSAAAKLVCERYVGARTGTPKVKSPKDFCASPRAAQLVAGGIVSPASAKEFLERAVGAVDKGMAWFINGKYKGNRNNFKYTDARTLETSSVNRDGRALIAGFALLTPNDHYFSLNYRRETTYKGAPKKSLCSPVAGGPNLQCEETALAPPSKSEGDLGNLEYRYFFGTRFAVSPTVTYNFDSAVKGVELPLYFLRDSAGHLIGGVQVGWRSDTDDVTLGAFVGTALKLAG